MGREAPRGKDRRFLSVLARPGADVQTPLLLGDQSVIMTMPPSAHVPSLHEQLAGLTGGEGVIDASFGCYQPIHGSFPSRQSRRSGQYAP